MSLEIGYVPEVQRLLDAITPFLPSERPEPAHWITTPDGDLGHEWCASCGYYKLRNLRRHDKERRDDYQLDGGYRTENDCFVSCESCGKPLDVTPTDYCINECLRNFEDGGFYEEAQATAFELVEILDRFEFRYEKEGVQRKEGRQTAIRIAYKFISPKLEADNRLGPNAI